MKIYNKTFRDKQSPEMKKAQRKAMYAKNKERERETANAYYAANKVKMRAYSKAYHKIRYAANKPAFQVRSKAWHKANPERARANHIAWAAANPESASNSSRTRRAIKRNATIGEKMVMLKWEKSWKAKKTVVCYWCRNQKASKTCHVDHIKPLSKGGIHAIENLCISCAKCNRSKSAKNLKEWNTELQQPVLI